MFCHRFFQHQISEVPRSISVKFCTVLSFRPSFIMLVQNFGGLPPPQKKIVRAKNVQNLAWFLTTSKLGGEYLRNGWRYLKFVNYLSYSDSFRVRRNKSCELCFSNLGDVKLYPAKAPLMYKISGSPHPKKLGGEKLHKFGAISHNFWVLPRMSQTSTEISKIWNRLDRGRSVEGLAKNCWFWSTNKKVMGMNVDLPLSLIHISEPTRPY